MTQYTREERVLIELEKRKHAKSVMGTVPLGDDEAYLIKALASKSQDREAAIQKLVEALEEIKNNLQTEDVYGNKDIAKEALSIWQKANE